MPGFPAVPGTSESRPDMGTIAGGSAAGPGGGLPDPNGSMNGDAVQERIQGVSRLLNKTAATIGEHVKGLGTLATQFPQGSKRLQSAMKALEKAQNDCMEAISDIVREAQTKDQQNAPAVIR